jgi:glutamate synthase domain-containing protein 1
VAETLGNDEFYVPSMSCRTIIYKGCSWAPQLFAYYLTWPTSGWRAPIVHQRYSTSHFPVGGWPTRMIAHNGEINTLRNANRLQGRKALAAES